MSAPDARNAVWTVGHDKPVLFAHAAPGTETTPELHYDEELAMTVSPDGHLIIDP